MKDKKFFQGPSPRQPPSISEKSLNQENSFMRAIRDLLQYKDCPSEVPYFLAEKPIKLIDPSYSLIGLTDIGGEGFVFKCADETGELRCIKIATPHSQAIGHRNMPIWERIKFRQKTEDSNTYRDRFVGGTKVQRSVYKQLQEDNIRFFSVPAVWKVSLHPGLYLEMEWIDSVHILRYLKERKSKKYAFEMFGVLLDAVEYLHQFGVIHRDLKSQNIYIGPNNSLVLLDWTLSKEVGNRGLTIEGTAFGTHMSPKIAHGEAASATYVDDICSLATVLFEFATIQDAPKFLTRQDIREGRVDIIDQKYIEHRKKLANHLMKHIQSVYLIASDPDEKKRFQTIADFRIALNKAIAQIKFKDANIIEVSRNEAKIETESSVNASFENIPQKKDTALFLKNYLNSKASDSNHQARISAIFELVLEMKKHKII